MTQLSVEAPRPARSTQDNPAEALAAVVDNAAALARAELRLAAAEAKATLLRLGLGLSLLWLSLLLAQVFALLLALTPLLLRDQPGANVALMLALSFVPLLAAFAFARRELRRLKDVGHESHGNDHH